MHVSSYYRRLGDSLQEDDRTYASVVRDVTNLQHQRQQQRAGKPGSGLPIGDEHWPALSDGHRLGGAPSTSSCSSASNSVMMRLLNRFKKSVSSSTSASARSRASIRKASSTPTSPVPVSPASFPPFLPVVPYLTVAAAPSPILRSTDSANNAHPTVREPIPTSSPTCVSSRTALMINNEILETEKAPPASTEVEADDKAEVSNPSGYSAEPAEYNLFSDHGGVQFDLALVERAASLHSGTAVAGEIIRQACQSALISYAWLPVAEWEILHDPQFGPERASLATFSLFYFEPPSFIEDLFCTPCVDAAEEDDDACTGAFCVRLAEELIADGS